LNNKTICPLKKTKQGHNLARSVIVAILVSLIVALAVSLFFILVTQITPAAYKPHISFSSIIAGLIIVFVATFLLQLFSGYLLMLIVNALTDKKSYFAGLTAIAYSGFVFAIGFLLAGVVRVISLYLLSSVVVLSVLISGFAALIVLMIFAPLSLAVLYRAIRELFDTDMITAFVAVGCLGTVVVVILLMLSSVVKMTPMYM